MLKFARVVLLIVSLSVTAAAAPSIRSVDIGSGIVLHYVDQGRGVPVIFVHGSISDGGYWADQVPAFARHYRAIAYSRRYNYPNRNSPVKDYSAIADADDLAAFIRALHLGKAVIVGHSYGALTALFLAERHPGLVRAMVLAEPPAVSLLNDLPPPQTAEGKKMYADIQRRMVAPMQRDFRRGDTNAGVGDFMDYVFNDPHAWQNMSASERNATMRDAREWDVMMTRGTLFPAISPASIRKIQTPALVMSGDRSYPFLGLIDADLSRLLPHSRSVVIKEAGHQMWYQHPAECRRDVERFLQANGIAAAFRNAV